MPSGVSLSLWAWRMRWPANHPISVVVSTIQPPPAGSGRFRIQASGSAGRRIQLAAQPFDLADLAPCPDCSLGGHRLRITMVMRSLVSSGVANGVPPSSSNACTNVAPLRTDVRRDATHATHPMAGNAFDDAFKSSIPSGSNPCFPPCSSLHRPPARPEPSPVRSLTSYVFRRGHNHTASPNNIAAITPRLPIHPPRFNDSMHVRNRATAVRPAFGCRSIRTAGFRAICLPQFEPPYLRDAPTAPTRLTCSTTSNASCASAAVACGLNPASSPNATSREGTAAT